MTPTLSPTVPLKDSVLGASRRASDFLLSQQRRDGHWCALLTADTTLESDYILFQLWLYPPVNGVWNPETRTQVDRAARSILSRQLPDGGFNIYDNGPSEVSASVKAYTALKLAGYPASDKKMLALRRCILDLGGVQSANSYTKVNLSLFGLYPRDCCPSIPPEIMLMPGKLLYQMSAWTRTIIVSLAIVHAHNPQRPVPKGFNLEELHLPGKSYEFAADDSWLTWRKAFVHSDKILKLWENYGFARIRRSAIRKCEHWMVERFKYSDGLGAIYPPMMYAVMALDVLGYPANHAVRVEALRQFNNLMCDTQDKFFIQPCYSPIWDTAIAAYALAEAGETPAARLASATDWMIGKEIRRTGDWSVKRPSTEPSGWAFEYNNEHYPDIDDTAMVLLAFRYAGPRRRMGRVRCGQQLAVPEQCAFCGSQRDARPELCGYHGARAGGGGGAWRGTGSPGGAARRCMAGAQPGIGRQLVWPLGRGLYLWNVFRAPGNGRGRRRQS